MTKILRYTGTRKPEKGPIKLGDYPDYDGTTIKEVVFHPEWGDTITVSTPAAEMIMQQYPGVFVDLSQPQPAAPEAAPPVIDIDGVMNAGPGTEPTDPPDFNTRRKR